MENCTYFNARHLKDRDRSLWVPSLQPEFWRPPLRPTPKVTVPIEFLSAKNSFKWSVARHMVMFVLSRGMNSANKITVLSQVTIHITLLNDIVGLIFLIIHCKVCCFVSRMTWRTHMSCRLSQHSLEAHCILLYTAQICQTRNCVSSFILLCLHT